MNSIPFAGQAIGAFLSESTADYFGYKLSLVIVSLIQLVAVVSKFSRRSNIILGLIYICSIIDIESYIFMGPVYCWQIYCLHIHRHC